jgi:hypothetical protein
MERLNEGQNALLGGAAAAVEVTMHLGCAGVIGSYQITLVAHTHHSAAGRYAEKQKTEREFSIEKESRKGRCGGRLIST